MLYTTTNFERLYKIQKARNITSSQVLAASLSLTYPTDVRQSFLTQHQERYDRALLADGKQYSTRSLRDNFWEMQLIGGSISNHPQTLDGLSTSSADFFSEAHGQIVILPSDTQTSAGHNDDGDNFWLSQERLHGFREVDDLLWTPCRSLYCRQTLSALEKERSESGNLPSASFASEISLSSAPYPSLTQLSRLHRALHPSFAGRNGGEGSPGALCHADTVSDTGDVQCYDSGQTYGQYLTSSLQDAPQKRVSATPRDQASADDFKEWQGPYSAVAPRATESTRFPWGPSVGSEG